MSIRGPDWIVQRKIGGWGNLVNILGNELQYRQIQTERFFLTKPFLSSYNKYVQFLFLEKKRIILQLGYSALIFFHYADIKRQQAEPEGKHGLYGTLVINFLLSVKTLLYSKCSHFQQPLFNLQYLFFLPCYLIYKSGLYE